MLLNITIENFRSYNEAQTLSLIASENNGVNSAKVGDLEVRKSAVIYGANASGKSNIIKAGLALIDILTNDIRLPEQFQRNSIYKPFFGSTSPTKISVDFSVLENIYTYSLSYDDKRIYFESLLDVNDNIIFERSLGSQSNEYEYIIPETSWQILLNDEQLDIAESLFKQFKSTTSERRTFLRHLVENNCKKIEPILQSMRNVIIRLNPYGVIGKPLYAESDLHYAANYFRNTRQEQQAISALNHIGVNLQRMNVTFNDNDPLPGERPSEVRKITSSYALKDGVTCELDFLNDESDGTQKFYSYFALVDFIIKYDGVLVVDELETHFHPLMVEEIIRAVHNSNSKAQLIFTTHNPTFLTESIFERDQIYFAEKNDKLATELYSLADFSDLKADSNLMAKYLAGRFGAIPYLNAFTFNGVNNG